ncbi:MAG: STAS domain-containing protein [Kofleriaceae bacterium]
MDSDFFDVQRTDDGARIAVRRMLDINTAPQLAEQVDRLLAAKPREVVVDLAGLDVIDSSGVAVLVKLYKGVRNLGGKLTIVGARDQPLAIFKLLRMDKVFGI